VTFPKVLRSAGAGAGSVARSLPLFRSHQIRCRFERRVGQVDQTPEQRVIKVSTVMAIDQVALRLENRCARTTQKAGIFGGTITSESVRNICRADALESRI
jgi:hypothetical protein